MELTDLRQRVNLEPQAVAKKLRVAESTVRNWESGRTTPRLNIDQFHHLCEIYGCSFDELYAAFRATKARTGKHREVTTHSRTLSALRAAGWDVYPHVLEIQKIFTAGRIEVQDNSPRRLPRKCVDFLLYYTQDFPIAVVEVKAEHRAATNGLEQAKHYAATLGVKFAYSTNGREILEFDFMTGTLRECNSFPTPNELWARQKAGEKLNDEVAKRLLAPSKHLISYQPRYYQEAAINRAVQSILQKQRRMLITMAPGTGKTFVAFQICWKLWSTRWNRTGEYRRPRILFLADRNISIEQSIKTLFTTFGDAYWKINSGEFKKGRDIYLATYQTLISEKNEGGSRVYHNYSPDFFDLIIVDDCHRGSSRDGSSWRKILEYFEPSYQIGLTALPQLGNHIDTVEYFGHHVYTYSLRQGIEDGFLAPLLIHQVKTSLNDWYPTFGEIDYYGQTILGESSQTPSLDAKLVLKAQTQEFAQHLSKFMKQTDRFAKTIVFCVDEAHAEEMLFELRNINADLVQEYPDYVCRVTASTGQSGQDSLRRFQDVETKTPVIITTSKMLVTGVDIPTCKNIVLARPINSRTEFMQIIGRGVRVRDDCGKFYCNIIDYTNSTRLFADLEFDGKPELFFETEVNEVNKLSQKYTYDGGIEIVSEIVYECNPGEKQQQLLNLIDYTTEKIHTLYRSANELRQLWSNPQQRENITSQLEKWGITSDELQSVTNLSDTDLLDILCHIAFDEPILTRQQRVERLRTEEKNFFERYSSEAKAILNELLNKYVEHGTSQFYLPGALKLSPISNYGNVRQIAQLFGGLDELKNSIYQLQVLLYAV